MSIGLEILPIWTYNQYVTLGLIEEPSEDDDEKLPPPPQPSPGGQRGGGGGGRGGPRGAGGPPPPGGQGASGNSSSEPLTAEVCQTEEYEEMVDAKNQLVQFESVDDMIDSFLRAGYDTVDNYKRVFGGQVDFGKPSVDPSTGNTI